MDAPPNGGWALWSFISRIAWTIDPWLYLAGKHLCQCRVFEKECPLEVSPLKLDSYTLVFSIAMLALFMSAVSFILGSGNSQHRRGLKEWGQCMACCAGAFLLFFFRGHAPWFLTFLLANTLILAALPYGLLAHARLYEVNPPRREMVIATTFGMSGILAAYLFDAPRSVSIFTASLGMAFQIGLIADLIRKNLPSETTPLARISASVMAMMAVAFSIRAVLAVFGDASSVTVAATSLQQIVALLGGGVFIAFSSIGFIAMVNERQQRSTVERLQRDGLTGLLTRSAFFEMSADIETKGAKVGYAVIFVDIDHFKSVNDHFGHAGGDLTLAHAARLISNSIRISDVAVRYGGEEFFILLMGCTEPEAAQLAENLVANAALQTVRLPDGRTTQYTLSAGYACTPARRPENLACETLEAVIDRADQALYRAKAQGRNQALASHWTPPTAIAILQPQ
jgi:diguanylate cyclase (GGDEF)-like protein